MLMFVTCSSDAQVTWNFARKHSFVRMQNFPKKFFEKFCVRTRWMIPKRNLVGRSEYQNLCDVVFQLTTLKMKFSIRDFFSKCDQIQYLMEWKTFFVQCLEVLCISGYNFKRQILFISCFETG